MPEAGNKKAWPARGGARRQGTPRNEPGQEARTRGARLPGSSGPHPEPRAGWRRAAKPARTTQLRAGRGIRGNGTRLLRESCAAGLLARLTRKTGQQRTPRCGCVPSSFSFSAKGESVSPCRVPHVRPTASESGKSAPESARQALAARGDRGANPLRNLKVQRDPYNTLHGNATPEYEDHPVL